MKKIIILLGFLLLMLIPTVLADETAIGQGSNYIKITGLEEIIHIRDRDLEKSMEIVLHVEKPKETSILPSNFVFIFVPERATNRFPFNAKIKEFKVCIGGFRGHNYDEIDIACEKELDYNLTQTCTNDYKYKISLDGVNFYDNLAIKINYEFENFLEEGSEKILKLETTCYPLGNNYEGCPNPEGSIRKYINLPRYAVSISHPEKAHLTRLDSGGKRIIQRDFIPTDELTNKYAILEIGYTDERILIRKTVLYGIVAGLIAGFIINIIFFVIYYHKFDKPHDKKSDEINTSLKKIDNKIEDVKNLINKKFKNDKPKNTLQKKSRKNR